MKGLTGTILWGCVAAGIGVGLFFLKHEVKEQEARLASLNQEIRRNQEAIHVLKAEWAYLNDPARLRQLSERHLGLKPMQPSQIATLDGREHAPAAMAAAKSAQPTQPAAVAKAETAKPAPMGLKAEPAKPGKPDPKAKQQPTAVAKAEPKPQAPAQVLAAPPQAKVAKSPAPQPTAPAARRTIVIQSPALAASELNASGEPR
jgi:hypothetical protein